MSAQTILIVDDSKMSRMMVSTFIRNTFPEHTILEADNGDKALEIASGKNIDKMILDYNMPGMTGEELATILRPEFPDAKITLLTANVQDVVKERAAKIDVGHIAKPITEDKILSFIL